MLKRAVLVVFGMALAMLAWPRAAAVLRVARDSWSASHADEHEGGSTAVLGVGAGSAAATPRRATSSPRAAQSEHGLPVGASASVGEPSLPAGPAVIGSDEANAAPVAAKDPSSGDVTPEEEEVLQLYEDIAQALDHPAVSCKDLGIQVSDFVGQELSVLERLAQARGRMTAAQRQAATERLEQSAGAQLARLRQSLRVGLGRCPGEPRLNEAIRTMAAAGSS